MNYSERPLWSIIEADEDISILIQEIQNGRNINEIDFCGNSLLHSAIKYGRHDIVKYLLENNANINTRNILTWTPLHYTAFIGNVQNAIMLLDYGADETLLTSNGFSIINVAKRNGHDFFISTINHYLLSREIWNCWTLQ